MSKIPIEPETSIDRIGALEERLTNLIERDNRLDELSDKISVLADQTDAVSKRLAKLETPFWKRPTMVGGATAVLGLVVGYVLFPFIASDPALPKFVHQHFLHTDRAIAGTLGPRVTQAVKENSDDPALQVGLRALINEHLDSDKEAEALLAQTVRDKQENLYHGSKHFFAREITTKSLGCLVSYDAYLREKLFWDVAPSELDKLCDDEREDVEPLAIRVFETTSLVIPFAASANDTVEVRVVVQSTTDDGQDTVLLDASKYVLLTVDQGDDEIAFDATRRIPGTSTAMLNMSGPDRLRNVSLSLNDKGYEKMNSGNPLSLSAVVTVRKE
jgi:hypothetical protein